MKFKCFLAEFFSVKSIVFLSQYYSKVIGLSAMLLLLITFSINSHAGKVSVPESAEDVCPIKTGQVLPDVKLKGVDGKDIALSKVVEKKPTVLVFYRGGWCPYCNVHLGELRKIEGELTALGYQIIAVSPDSPENLKATMEKQEMKYTLLSDHTSAVSQALGLAFKVDSETYKKYLGYGINLEKASGEKHHMLPVPAAMIVDQKGLVQFSFTSPNYKVRIDNDVLIAAAKSSLKN